MIQSVWEVLGRLCSCICNALFVGDVEVDKDEPVRLVIIVFLCELLEALGAGGVSGCGDDQTFGIFELFERILEIRDLVAQWPLSLGAYSRTCTYQLGNHGKAEAAAASSDEIRRHACLAVSR